MDQTLSAAAIHGTDRVKAMLDALTHITSPSPGSVPIGPQHGAAGSSNSSAGNTQPPARQQTAHGQHGQPQEGQNCEYPDLNRGQGNAQVPPTQPSYPPPRNGSEVWLGPQSAPTDTFAAMKAIFDNWHGQGNANTSPTQETGQSGRPMGDILLVTPTPATATAVGTPTPATATVVGTTVGQLGTNGHNTTGSSATNGNNVAQYTCTVGSLTAHVSEALKEKIWRSEYVDIFELLRKEGEGSDSKCHEACKLSAREKPFIAKTLANWSAGFRILSSIIGQKFPEKCCSLIAYQDVICGSYRMYGGTAWLEYDEQFRRNMAVNPGLEWDRKDIDLWLSKITPYRQQQANEMENNGHNADSKVDGQLNGGKRKLLQEDRQAAVQEEQLILSTLHQEVVDGVSTPYGCKSGQTEAPPLNNVTTQNVEDGVEGDSDSPSMVEFMFPDISDEYPPTESQLVKESQPEEEWTLTCRRIPRKHSRWRLQGLQ
ncbi:uncharacterized protein LOC115083391 [Rhinatrema bivittatum]|uniref:uncharacterized protein LOC115083391 n=1 Tax=Rhinatrema bivittatum TaxID=194408 RepID=UPI00112A71F5|nr:uncharacterized protein LOC115083391 [Rhinatrema bivittatum]